MTRLELLHTIQENADQLPLVDAVSLVAGRLPDDADVHRAWENLTRELIAWSATSR